MTTQSQRDRFEAWWVRDIPEPDKAAVIKVMQQSRYGDGKYGFRRAQDAWEGWVGAEADVVERCAEGLTDEQREALQYALSMLSQAHVDSAVLHRRCRAISSLLKETQ